MQKQSRLYILIGLIVVLIVGLWSAAFIVYPRQQIAVKRLGQILRVETEPGLYFKIPFIDQSIIIDDRLRRLDLPQQRLQVRGGLNYDVDAFLLYRISDADRFLRAIQSGNPTVAEQRNLSPRFDTALRAVYGQRGFEAALSEERSEMMREVQRQIEQEAAPLGITIEDVRIRKTDLPSDVSERTYQRMRSERTAVAEGLRAQGMQEKDAIVAQAEREATEIVAAATRDSEIIRGEGEGEKARIVAEATRENPEFYSFWRSMDAYRNIQDTPMVLSPDSVFFEYLRTPLHPKGVPDPSNQAPLNRTQDDMQ